MAITVRILKAEDVPQARRIFADGMMSTITQGARSAPVVVSLSVAAGVLAGVVTRLVAPFHPVASCVAAACGFALLYFGWPKQLAHSYVTKSLSGDMQQPMTHYVNSPGGKSCFWVAVDSTDGRVVGTVAVEPPDPTSGVTLDASGKVFMFPPLSRSLALGLPPPPPLSPPLLFFLSTFLTLISHHSHPHSGTVSLSSR
jgi:hypothetical protein